MEHLIIAGIAFGLAVIGTLVSKYVFKKDIGDTGGGSGGSIGGGGC